jgi:hypothetical protein
MKLSHTQPNQRVILFCPELVSKVKSHLKKVISKKLKPIVNTNVFPPNIVHYELTHESSEKMIVNSFLSHHSLRKKIDGKRKNKNAGAADRYKTSPISSCFLTNYILMVQSFCRWLRMSSQDF